MDSSPRKPPTTNLSTYTKNIKLIYMHQIAQSKSVHGFDIGLPSFDRADGGLRAATMLERGRGLAGLGHSGYATVESEFAPGLINKCRPLLSILRLTLASTFYNNFLPNLRQQRHKNR